VATISMIVALVVAAVLMWSGLEKARDLAPLASTILDLGASGWQANVAARIMAFTEIAVAVTLVLRPDSTWTQLGLVTLVGTFALAGIRAMWLGKPIRCSCFSSRKHSYLGWRQVLALVPWLGAAALIRAGLRERSPALAGVDRLALVTLVITASRAAAVWIARSHAYDDRRSTQEMFSWLR
jgi:hypothetical protein